MLDDFSLEVEAGECVVLIGASGSGKSTLLRCVNLLETVDDGVIELDGTDITDPRVDTDRVRSGIGIVFQAYNLFPHLSVLDNVTLAPIRVHGVRPRRRPHPSAGDAGPRGPGGQSLGTPRRTLRRAATARRHRPCAGQLAKADAAGRGHLGARP